MNGTVLAIDPGIEGALSWVSADGILIETDDMPVIEVRGKRRVNAAEVREMILSRAVAVVVIEGVMAMPGQPASEGGKERRMGASSAFNFGYGAGVLEGVAIGLGLPVQIIPASSWKRLANVPKDKGACREMAARLWPGAASRFKRVRDSGRADAALLARYVALDRSRRHAA